EGKVQKHAPLLRRRGRGDATARRGVVAEPETTSRLLENHHPGTTRHASSTRRGKCKNTLPSCEGGAEATRPRAEGWLAGLKTTSWPLENHHPGASRHPSSTRRGKCKNTPSCEGGAGRDAQRRGRGGPCRIASRSDDYPTTNQHPKEHRMATQIFVNLPVKDLNRSVAFFTQLGYTFDPRFTDETATCMIVADNIFVMLLTEPKFQSFIPNPICDANKCTEVLLALSCESREQVHEMVRKAV